MKKFLKILAIVLGVIILAVAGILTYVKTALPNVGPAPELKVDITPERLKRGKYLAHHVSLCMDCHSKRDFTYWSGPLVPGTLGEGGEEFTTAQGFPGNFYARNITPSHLKDWTDGDIYRAITSGVNKDNKPLFSIMPWENYGQMDPEDIKDMIAYIRSLPSQSNEPPKSEAAFPMNFILNTIPKKGEGGKRPDPSDVIAYGKYYTMASGCNVCHTKHDKGQMVGEPFAGGFEFLFPDGSVVASPNITPDAETGIGSWDEELFISKFKQYADSNYHPAPLKPGEMQTVMPWTMYAHKDSVELKAIYAYLKSLKPAKNQVVRWKPKTS